MARNAARWGRLRRVLNDDPSHGCSHLAAMDADIVPGDTPRYGAGANIENHPQVTDFVPRRFRAVAMVLIAGLTIGAVAEVTAYFAEPLSEWAQVVSSEEITSVVAGRLNAWTSAAVLLVVAVYARLIYSLRRHRVDDVRGSYRIWRLASYLAIFLSANAVVAGHSLAGNILGHLTGWTLLANNMGWWLLPTLLGCGFILARITYDAAECRSALLAYFTGMGCLAAGIACSIGWLPISSVNFGDTFVRTLPLSGYLCLLAGCLLYSRYIVLDVQGLIDHGNSTSKAERQESASLSLSETGDSDAESDDADDRKWVDGTEPVDDYPEDDYLLSKAERKRLRKQKSRRAA